MAAIELPAEYTPSNGDMLLVTQPHGYELDHYANGRWRGGRVTDERKAEWLANNCMLLCQGEDFWIYREQASARQKSGARFWFRDEVRFIPSVESSILDGTVTDVIRIRDGEYDYMVTDKESGITYYCKEARIRFPHEFFSQEAIDQMFSDS